jgi:hypothetical protein
LLLFILSPCASLHEADDGEDETKGGEKPEDEDEREERRELVWVSPSLVLPALTARIENAASLVGASERTFGHKALILAECAKLGPAARATVGGVVFHFWAPISS